jgi:RNA polymerase sigma factor (sigma-70 family)
MTDWQLIEAYRAGDEDAFANLVQKYYALVYGAACRRVCDVHLAQDVTQCVFLLFSRKAKTLPSSIAIGGWFLRTVRFVCLDVVRKGRHWQRLENEDLVTETMETPFDPTGPLASLEEAILALSGDEQVCLLGKYYEGKSFKELGTELNISEDAAGKRVTRALEKMRNFFRRRGVKISVAAIPVVLNAGFAISARGAAAQAGTSAVLAAIKGGGATSASSSLAAHAAKVLAWKQWTAAAIKCALVLAFVGGGAGWYWINSQPPLPATTAVPFSDARIGILGRSWSDVMQRAALMRHRFPQTPRPADARLPAARQENKSLFRDRMGLSWGLQKLGQEGSLRNILPAYLVSGMDELLTLSPSQRALIFDAVQQFIPEGSNENAISSLLETNKPKIAAAIRPALSIRQRGRFDRVCGPNGEFLLINRTSYGRSPGYMAWQDWLGGGGIITPREAMETVPPELW